MKFYVSEAESVSVVGEKRTQSRLSKNIVIQLKAGW